MRFRIDGVLHQVYQIPASVLAAMTSRIKILGAHGRGGEAPAAGRPHQDAHRWTAQEIELRLSTLPTAFGEKLVMRIFDPEVLVRDFKELGFSDEDSKRWKDMTERPNGIVLVTGPTGSGKTTTLYSTLKSWRRRRSTSAPSRTRSRWSSRLLQPDAGAARRSTSASPRACAR